MTSANPVRMPMFGICTQKIVDFARFGVNAEADNPNSIAALLAIAALLFADRGSNAFEADRQASSSERARLQLSSAITESRERL